MSAPVLPVHHPSLSHFNIHKQPSRLISGSLKDVNLIKLHFLLLWLPCLDPWGDPGLIWAALLTKPAHIDCFCPGWRLLLRLTGFCDLFIYFWGGDRIRRRLFPEGPGAQSVSVSREEVCNLGISNFLAVLLKIIWSQHPEILVLCLGKQQYFTSQTHLRCPYF